MKLKNADQKKAQAAAVLELLKLSREKATDEVLEKARVLEERAKMSAVDQLNDIANNPEPYADSRMRQTFPTIKDVVAVKGRILVIVDEAYALKLATEEAINVLGVLADPAELLKYTETHRNKTTLLTVGKFMRNLSNLLYLAKSHPEMFGSDSGGGPLKDFVEAANAAIKEAHNYLIKTYGNEVGDIPASEMGFDVPELTNVTDFTKVLGADWDNELTPEQRFNLYGLLLKDKKVR